jgi:hypothetical protein
VGYVDWKKNFAWIVYDITANGGVVKLPSMQPTSGGTILEAEDAKFRNSLIESSTAGFTGQGYLATKIGDAKHQVTWTYTAPESGGYILEFRYTQKRLSNYSSDVLIKGKKAGELTFWNTGNTGAWFWERITVNLEKGENSIEISPEGWVLLDHLNIIMN